METQIINPESIEQKESIKLIKNTKGFSWELRILSLDVDKIEKLNNQMTKRFGVNEIIDNEK